MAVTVNQHQFPQSLFVHVPLLVPVFSLAIIVSVFMFSIMLISKPISSKTRIETLPLWFYVDELWFQYSQL
jgi:hypothetical protein